jgi:hypothetical protein
MNKSILHLGVILCSTICYSQTDTISDFEKEFQKSSADLNKDFDDFEKKINKEYADFLKKNWDEFQIEKPSLNPLDKKPLTPPVFNKKNNDSISNKVVVGFKDTTALKLIEQKDTVSEVKIPLQTNDIVHFNGNILTVNFYNQPLIFRFDNKSKVFCNDATELSVSNFWKEISSSNYKPYLVDILNYKNKFILNDWALYQLVKVLSEHVFKSYNSQVAFQFFTLSQLGYDVRVARSNESLVLLLNIQNQVYETSTLSIESKKYYIMSPFKSKSVYTFRDGFKNDSKAIDLNIQQDIELFKNIKSREILIEDKKLKINLDYSPEMVDFYSQMPLTDFSVFFNAKTSSVTKYSIEKNLLPLIKDKSELEAVSFLLNFVQKGFEYKTDRDQFGKEKYFFVEEILNYPFSDCEDRSVFFSRLVKDLLGLKVVGILYKDHIATAVKFNTEVYGDKILVDGEPYVVCDPTYIGAFVGMTMPQYDGVSPKIIKVN